MIHFDHIEVHVSNSKKYTEFLFKLFNGGRVKKIADNNVYMFLSNENLHIEIKEVDISTINQNIENYIGFCLPCLRMRNALNHINNLDSIKIIKTINNAEGDCIFFNDYEGILWHIKDYDHLDLFVNI
jgi:hypothetical protein